MWIAWPRKAGGHVSDIAENDLRELLLAIGVVDVKVGAFDNAWSGPKFVWASALDLGRVVSSDPRNTPLSRKSDSRTRGSRDASVIFTTDTPGTCVHSVGQAVLVGGDP
ncbi:hypothetical protein AB0L63_27665 [Nocardia sp. NPDC051990]|uniref:hypothetical protein n=1 Tax=Nocardia sp. NPDC051990 TaxID=3155285 RepID=UPI003442C5E2